MKRFDSAKWITENKHGKILKEDYKPSHRAYNVIDKSNNDEIVAKELPRWKALELAHTNKNYMIDATDRLAETGGAKQARLLHNMYYSNFHGTTFAEEDLELHDIDPNSEEDGHEAFLYMAKGTLLTWDDEDETWVDDEGSDIAVDSDQIAYAVDEARADWTPPPMGMGGEEEEDEEEEENNRNLSIDDYKGSLQEGTEGIYLIFDKSNKLVNTLGDFRESEDEALKKAIEAKGEYTLHWDTRFDKDKGWSPNQIMSKYKGNSKEEILKDTPGETDIRKHGRLIPVDKPGSEYNKRGFGAGDLKEAASKLGYLKEVDGMEGGMDLNAVQYEKAEFVYSEQGGRFYALNLYTSDGQKTKLGLTQYDEANEWLKDTLAYIHEGDLIPKHYGSGLEDLDLIVDRLRELGIEASHNEYDFS